MRNGEREKRKFEFLTFCKTCNNKWKNESIYFIKLHSYHIILCLGMYTYVYINIYHLYEWLIYNLHKETHTLYIYICIIDFVYTQPFYISFTYVCSTFLHLARYSSKRKKRNIRSLSRFLSCLAIRLCRFIFIDKHNLTSLHRSSDKNESVRKKLPFATILICLSFLYRISI